MAKRYFKDLAYYFCEVVGSLLNFLSSLLGCYPKIELGIRFLYKLEERRFNKETEQQRERRHSLHKDGDDKFSEARKIL